jgi:hypothetical protein
MRQRFKAEIFSEPDGKPSLGRVLTVVIVAFVLGWDTSSMILAWHFNFLHPDHVMSVYPDASNAHRARRVYDALLRRQQDCWHLCSEARYSSGFACAGCRFRVELKDKLKFLERMRDARWHGAAEFYVQVVC